MLDSSLRDQLKALFAPLQRTVELRYDESSHVQQTELLTLLGDLAGTSDKIILQSSNDAAPVPRFAVHVDGRATGITFQGIPGGHEFSSLVLAVLNAGGLGKLPDEALAARIKRLRGPLAIRTYISLTCENCPDVVQALNQMALVHGDLQHVMIDGGMVQEELAELGIQGVPSVYVGDELIHSGRVTLAELLTKLEAKFGSKTVSDSHLGLFDVAVLGGGPAGVAAAIYSVRKGLKTALIAERIGGQLQETKGIENLISVVYTEGPQLSASVDQHLRSYPVEVLEHRRVRSVAPATLADAAGGTLQEVTLDSGERLSARSIIVATGAKWRELGVPGERDYIGRGVAFCPHCDGPYYKGKKVAVVGGGNSGVEAAIDLAGICSDVVLLEFADRLKADDVLVQKLKSLPNVTVVTSAKTAEVVGNGAKVVGLRYEDRMSGETRSLDLDGVFVQIGLSPNSDLVKDVVEVNRYGEIVVDAKGRTSAPGIYAAGDVTTTPYKQIVIAMGEGAKVALTAFEDRIRAA